MSSSRTEDEPAREPAVETDAEPSIEPGLGTLCPESQADGVPCDRPDADCRECPWAA